MHHLENLLGLLFIFGGSLNIKQIQVLANAFLNMKKARDPAGILYISLRHVPGIECPADLRYQSHALLVICSDLKPSNFRASYSYRVNSGPFFPWSYKTSMLGFLQHTAMGFPADRRDHRGHSLSWVTESFFEFCHHESRSFSEGLFILLSVPSIYSNLGKIPIASYSQVSGVGHQSMFTGIHVPMMFIAYSGKGMDTIGAAARRSREVDAHI